MLLEGRPHTIVGVTTRRELASAVGNLLQGSSQAVSSEEQRSVHALLPLVVGQDIAIRIAESHALGHLPDKYIPRNNLQPGEFLDIIDRPRQRPLSYTILHHQDMTCHKSNLLTPSKYDVVTTSGLRRDVPGLVIFRCNIIGNQPEGANWEA